MSCGVCLTLTNLILLILLRFVHPFSLPLPLPSFAGSVLLPFLPLVCS